MTDSISASHLTDKINLCCYKLHGWEALGGAAPGIYKSTQDSNYIGSMFQRPVNGKKACKKSVTLNMCDTWIILGINETF